MQLDAEVARETNDDAKFRLVELELDSLENVRKALEELTTKKLREDLSRDVANHSNESPVVRTVVRCGSEYLKSYSQDFWPKAFVEAFPRGDCLEKPGESRVHKTVGVDWTCLLLNQMDKPWLRCHDEWQAATMQYFIRLDQIRQTEAAVLHSSKLKHDAAVFHRLHAHDLTLLATQASDSATLRSLVNKDEVAEHVRSCMYHVHSVMKSVMGTDVEKAKFQTYFRPCDTTTALQWSFGL